MRKSMFGLLIGAIVLVLFIVVAVSFSTLIFFSEEAQINVTNLSNESRQAYNMTTTTAQIGISVWDVLVWLIVFGIACLGGFILLMAIR